MSQSAVFVSVNGILYHEIFPSVLNEESLIGICVDLECEEDAEIEYKCFEYKGIYSEKQLIDSC